MAGVRRVTRSILRYFYPLYAFLIVLQVYFAGEGIFGNRDKEILIEEHDSLELHRGMGFFLTTLGALLLLILALLAWFPSMRTRVFSILLPILLFVQLVLPGGGRWVAGLHPVNALVLLGLLGYLSRELWRGRAHTAEERSAVGTA